MFARGRALGVLLTLFAASALAAGCNGDGGDAGATATAAPSATIEATATPAPDIRQEPLAGQPGLSDFLGTSGGQFEAGRVIYADVTGDGNEEAVVPVSSGGEGGDIAIFVYGYGETGVQELLRTLPTETSSIMASIEEGQLMTVEGVYAPGDPLSFPSQLLRRYYTWDGSVLIIEREDQGPAR